MAKLKVYTFGDQWGRVDNSDCIQSIKILLDRLRKTPLDPRSELNGNFVVTQTKYNNISTCTKHIGMIQFYGQFYDGSLKFNILTNDHSTVKLLTEYIRVNQSTIEYQTLRKACNVCTIEPLSRFNMHIRRDVVLPKHKHIEPIPVWIVDADVGLRSLLMKLKCERIGNKYRFFTNPTTKLLNFADLLSVDKHSSNHAIDNTRTNSPKFSFSRRQMTEDSNKSFKFIGDRINSAFINVERIKSKLSSESDGPHREKLLSMLEQNKKVLNYWLCVSQRKGTPIVSVSDFQIGNIAYAEGHRTIIKEVQDHLITVQLLDNEHIGMIFHYPHAAFTEIKPQKQKLMSVA